MELTDIQIKSIEDAKVAAHILHRINLVPVVIINLGAKRYTYRRF